MGEYDFLVLSSDEFELFCKDILEEELEIKLENFKSGKDGGIDLRYAPNEDSTLIVQCKRYKDIKSLMKTLKHEVEKVKRLSPSRYILMTSVPLNPNDKDKIKYCFEGYIKSTGDIFGKDELQHILKNYPSIERKHYKLWLASTNVLDTIINNGILNRSKFTEQQIKEKISLYVPNDSFEQTLQHLEKSKVIIITGGPGVGKTTLADMLYLHYSSKGYQFIEISEDIGDGEKLYHPDQKQLFYYDDFLGRNFLNDKLSKNEDRRIINFIKKIMRSENKLFIMTTREYILKQAQINYDLLGDKSLDVNKYIINVENFTQAVKARILYNHLYFSDLPEEYIEVIIKEKTYRRIIEHQNYNPRLISRMTDELNYKEIPVDSYSKHFIQELNYPYRIWEHIFENQINEYSRLILQLLMIMGDREVNLTDLEKNFNALNFNIGRPFESISFKLGIKELEKTFIKINRNKKSQEVVWFQNPSVADFLIQYSSNSSNISTLWNSTLYFFPMFKVFSFSKIQGKITIPKHLHKDFLEIILRRFNEFLDCQNTSGKIQALSKLERYVDLRKGNAKGILIETFSNYAIDYSDEFTDLLIKYKDVLSEELDISGTLTFLVDNIEYYYEFLNLIKLYASYPNELDRILDEEMKRKIIDDVTADIKDYLNDEYDYEEIIGVLEESGNIFKVNVTDKIKEINEKYDEILEALQYDDDYDNGEYRIDDYEVSDEEQYVDDLFESLLYK